MRCPECDTQMDLAQNAPAQYTVWRCWHCTFKPNRPAHWSGTLVLRSGLASAPKRERIDLDLAFGGNREKAAS